MHELGVVFHIIENIEKIAAENGVKKVAQTTLQIGEVSMIVKEQFEDCWNWAIKKSDVLNGSRLTIETIPAITYCENCKQTYPTVKYAKICPFCNSERTYLMQGNEVAIKEIGVLDEDASSDAAEPDNSDG